MYLHLNLSYLIESRGLTKTELGKQLEIRRTTLSDYAVGNSTPNVKVLMKIADYFKVSLDDFVYKNLQVSSIKKVSEQKPAYSKRNNNPVINIRNYKAYLLDANKYIRSADKLSVPNLGDTRTFQIEGDAMYPFIRHTDYAVSVKVHNFEDIIRNRLHVVVLKSKILLRFIEIPDNKNMLLVSANKEAYPTLRHKLYEVVEVWEVKAKITRHLMHKTENIEQRLNDLEDQIRLLKQKT